MTLGLPDFVQEQTDEQKKEQELKRNRLSKLASIFARANSVLTGKRISVHVTDKKEMGAPAWSSTHEVWLNMAHIKDDLTARSLISLQGLDFHELSHLRFTPRNAHELPTWVKENDLWQAFNSLEDMRIENLMVGNLPSVANWLVATIADYLLDDDKTLPYAYTLTYGRKYLPTELQQLAIDNFAKPELTDELETIIDEYNDLVFDTKENTERAKELISAYAKLIEQILPPQEPNGQGEGEGSNRCGRFPDPFGHKERPAQGYESSSNRPAKPADQKKFRDKAKEKFKEKAKVKRNTPAPKENAESKDDTNADTNSSNKSDNKTQEQIRNRTEKVAERDYEVDFDDLEFDFNDDDEVDYGKSFEQAGEKSVGNSQGTTGHNQQVTDVINDIVNDVITDLSKELTSMAKQLGISIDLVGGNAETPQLARFTDVNAPAELVLISKAFQLELERLRAKHEPAWEYETEQGNLNIYRYLNNAEFDVCFDEWQEGRSDVTEIEAVILLDKSGSMSGVNADEAYKSMYGIKRALDSIGARTSVVLFDSFSSLLYSADEKANGFIRDGGASGGTNPEHSLLYAKRVLAETTKPIKLLFMITDGAWDTDEGEQAIKEMRNAGVLTCQAYLSQYQVSAEHLEPYRHGFELLTQIKSARDILTLGKELVRIAISRNLASR